MNDQNGFYSNGVYHFNYSSQPSDPWERPGGLEDRAGGEAFCVLSCRCHRLRHGDRVGGKPLFVVNLHSKPLYRFFGTTINWDPIRHLCRKCTIGFLRAFCADL